MVSISKGYGEWGRWISKYIFNDIWHGKTIY
jgi:hypothetical protein